MKSYCLGGTLQEVKRGKNAPWNLLMMVSMCSHVIIEDDCVQYKILQVQDSQIKINVLFVFTHLHIT